MNSLNPQNNPINRVLLLFPGKKTEAEKKKQPAQDYTVTTPTESIGNSGFFQNVNYISEFKFSTSHLQKGDNVSFLSIWLKISLTNRSALDSWLSGKSVGPPTEGSRVQFWSRTHISVADSIPGGNQ